MASAVFALDEVARLHGLEVEDTHVSFGGVAFAWAAQAVPVATRAAILGADAVLVAGADEPALEDVMSELDLRAQVTRVRFGHADDVAFVFPLKEEAAVWAAHRAFEMAETRSLRLAVVGDEPWFELVDEVAEDHEHVRGEHLAPRVAVPLAAFNAARFDVVLIAPTWAEAGPVVPAAASAAVFFGAFFPVSGRSAGGFFPVAGFLALFFLGVSSDRGRDVTGRASSGG